MTLRHKAYKTALSTGLASEWNDDHWADFRDELLAEWTFPAHNIPAEFTNAVTGSATVDVGMANNHNSMNLLTGATSSSVASLKLGDTDTTNKLDLPIFTSTIKLESNDLAEFGFFVYANTPFTANQKGAYFRISGGKLYAVTGTGAAETATEIGNLTTYGQYKIEFTSIDVRFYLDDLITPVATHTTTIPTEDITLKVSLKTQTTTPRILRMDGLALMRLREQ